MNSFETLNTRNVNEHTEQKGNLTYLSWAWAWAEIKKLYPNATYDIKKFNGGFPYLYDEKTGYMVFTSVTIDGLTYEMWLPVMDSNNKTMLDKPYTIQTKYREITIAAATMFDINKTIMRCLVKNLAMFGLGLYIYAGEDLPEGTEPPETGELPFPDNPPDEKMTDNDLIKLNAVLDTLRGHSQQMYDNMLGQIRKKYNADDVNVLTKKQCYEIIHFVNKQLEKSVKK